MKLLPREIESLLVHQAGFVAQKRLARGLRLNHPEAVALISCVVRILGLMWAIWLSVQIGAPCFFNLSRTAITSPPLNLWTIQIPV
jgi:hypothetical protein